MKNAVKLTLLCVLTMSTVAHAKDAPKLVGEKEIMKLNDNIAYRRHQGAWSMRLSPDGRRVLYLRKKTYKTTRADGSQRDRRGYKLVLRDLKTGKDTVVPVPALFDDSFAVAWMSMTVFDPTGRTLIVPAGQDGNKNGLMERTEKCKAGLYDIASEKLKTFDIESNVIFPTFHPDGKTLVVLALEGARTPTDVKVHITPTDKIKFRTLSKAGMIRSLSPTSDLMAIVLLTEGERPRPGRCVLYDLKTDTVKAELVGKDQTRTLLEHNPQWTADGRYIYHIIIKDDVRDGRSHSETMTRIWDAKAGKEVSIISGVAPIGPGPDRGTMVLVRLLITPRVISPEVIGDKDAAQIQPPPKVEREIVLHARGDKTLGPGLHPLGDKSMRPISTQGKWLLFIRTDANGNEKACMAEIALPKKSIRDAFKTARANNDPDRDAWVAKALKNLRDDPPADSRGRERRSGKVTVGFSQIGSESDWRAANTRSIKREAVKRRVVLRFADAQQRQQNQIKALRSFVAQGVDVIAFSPMRETGWQTVLEEIKKAGIPVILTDRSVDVTDSSLYVTLLASDFVEEGRRAARWFVENTKGDLKIFELRGVTGSSCAIDRNKGFEEIIAKHARIKILKSQDGDFARGRGKDVTEAFLKTPAGKEFNALYAHNDDMALGAIQAMKEAGLKPGKDIKIVSIDAVKAAFNAMIDGELNCTVECSPLLGPKLFDIIEAVLAAKKLTAHGAKHKLLNPSVLKALGGDVFKKRVVVDEGVFDQSAAKKLLDTREY